MSRKATKVSGKVFIRGKIKKHQQMVDKAMKEAREENGQFVFGENKEPLAPFLAKQETLIGTLCMTLHQAR